jgi:hypothetical protein
MKPRVSVRIDSTQNRWFSGLSGREAGPCEQWPKALKDQAKLKEGHSGLSPLRSDGPRDVQARSWMALKVAKDAQGESWKTTLRCLLTYLTL